MTSFIHSFSQLKTKIYWVPICARHMARPGDCLIGQTLLLRHSQANRGKRLRGEAWHSGTVGSIALRGGI